MTFQTLIYSMKFAYRSFKTMFSKDRALKNVLFTVTSGYLSIKNYFYRLLGIVIYTFKCAMYMY